MEARRQSLTESERHQILVQWNNTQQAYPRDRCLHELFEQQARKTPQAVAVVYEDQHLTYQQLDERANQLAHHLRGLGVGPDVLVGICVERSLEMVVGLLGILKAGGAYVPMDPTYPVERLQFMLQHTHAPVLLTRSGIQTRLPSGPTKVICLDGEWTQIARESIVSPGIQVSASSLAYVIYTSGSTGKPKGVMVPHSGLSAYLLWAVEVYDVVAGGGTLVSSPLVFDLTVTSLLTPLICGQRAVLLPESNEISALVQHINNGDDITLVKITPSHLRILKEQLTTRGLSSVRCYVIGGEALYLADVMPWLSASPTPRLINEYGPTETVVGCCIHEARMDGDYANGVLIGRPSKGTQLLILDAQQQAVPDGIEGELYIGGVQVGLGYLDNPKLTEERFVRNPFGPGMLYRSGDLVRRKPDGNIEFLGRLDHQVKIRGFRIELGEIETVLGEHPQVRQTVVVAREMEPGDMRLVAYVVWADTASTAGADELHIYLHKSLPEYMVPSLFVSLKALPLTPNGKVDRAALPNPEPSRPQMRQDYVKPRNETERALAAIWQKVLKVDAVGIHDNFFDLGGHSLLATRVVAQVRTLLNVELPLKTVFESPTIAEVAQSIRVLGDAVAVPSVLPGPGPQDHGLPLSFAQQAMWLLDQYEPETPAYNISFALDLAGELHVAWLRQSLQSLIDRHEALRNIFPAEGGAPVQVIIPCLTIDLTTTDLSHLLEQEQTGERDRVSREELSRHFDLAAGPLVRARLLRLGQERHRLLLSMHHIVSDGWSMAVVLDELAKLYNGLAAGVPAQLSPLPIRYADYARWQRQWLQGRRMEEQIEYWKQRLAGAPALLELPTDRPRPTLRRSRGATISSELPSVLCEQLQSLSRRHDVTLFMTLLAGFSVLLHRFSGQTDIVIGTPVAGRPHAETEGLVGMFVNTLALRLDLSGNPTVVELLHRVRDVAMEALAHQDLPFEKLVEALAPARSTSYQPVLQVMMVLQNTPQAQTAMHGLRTAYHKVHTGTAKLDLTLEIEPTESGLRGTIEYCTDLFDATTAERMLTHCQRIFAAMVREPQQRIGQISTVTEGEAAQRLVRWTGTAREYPRDKCIHQLFEEQAARTPHAVAVVCEDQHLTYQQLDQRANQLAHYLRRLGVGPEVLVGICVERSLAMVVGLLGILKAGGAYVPMDPTYPAERIGFMLGDAKVPVILTDSRIRERLPACLAKIISLDDDWPTISGESAVAADIQLPSSSLAYVIYTSGSTGKPKGCMLEHRQVVRLMAQTEQWYGFRESDVWTLFHSIAFDFSVWELWGALLYGGKLVVVPYQVSRSPGEFANLLEKERVTVLNQTPSAFTQLLKAMEDRREHASLALRYIIFGGEALDLGSLRPWYELYGSLATRLVNMYGITETTVHVTYRPIACDEIHAGTGSVIGVPIPDLRVHVLDTQMKPVAVGQEGEIYVAGDGLARGYLNRPELTAQRFINAPDWLPEVRLYKSGDLARVLPGGDLEYRGRMDHQVKIRGFRIELGEIESVLGQHPQVRQAVVMARQIEPGDKRLTAYVLWRDSSLATLVGDLRAFMLKSLPDYMVPSQFVSMEALPLTPNGKVDRAALPLPETSRPQMGQDYVMPRDEMERALAAIWQEVLKVDAVGIHDNFFDLGGHSLLAVSLSARIEARFGAVIPLATFFIAPTIAGLAEHVRSKGIGGASSPIVCLKAGSPRPPLFCIPGAGGDAMGLRDLANLLGPDQPVYGMQFQGMDGESAPHARIEDMARYFLDAIDSVLPEGPYHLAGFSAGGLVAYEMAQQLHRSGRQVAFLALLDTCAPGYPPLLPLRVRLGRHLREITSRPPRLAAAYTLDRLKAIGRRLAPRKTAPRSVAGLGGSVAVAIERTNLAMRDAIETYQPVEYEGRITLFRAAQTPEDWIGSSFEDTSMGWSEYAVGGLDVHHTPSSHLGMVKDSGVHRLAAALRACLDQLPAEALASSVSAE